LNEPLRHLDAKLAGADARRVLRVHRRNRGRDAVTFPHDQTEAMTWETVWPCGGRRPAAGRGAPGLYTSRQRGFRGATVMVRRRLTCTRRAWRSPGSVANAPWVTRAIPARRSYSQAGPPGPYRRRHRDRRHPPGEPGRSRHRRQPARDGAGAGGQPHRRRPLVEVLGSYSFVHFNGRAAGPVMKPSSAGAERRAGSLHRGCRDGSPGRASSPPPWASGVARVRPRATIRAPPPRCWLVAWSAALFDRPTGRRSLVRPPSPLLIRCVAGRGGTYPALSSLDGGP